MFGIVLLGSHLSTFDLFCVETLLHGAHSGRMNEPTVVLVLVRGNSLSRRNSNGVLEMFRLAETFVSVSSMLCSQVAW